MEQLLEAIAELPKLHEFDKFSWSLEIILQSYTDHYKDTRRIRFHIHLCLERVFG